MGAVTEIYIDGAVVGPGTGSIGDPYKGLENAIIQETFDTTNGVRLNVQKDTPQVIAAALQNALNDVSVSVAWTPAVNKPCMIQGYDTAAGDLNGTGLRATISGGGLVGIFNDAVHDGIVFVDIHGTACGVNTVFDLDNNCHILRCEASDADGAGMRVDNYSSIISCHVHNVGLIGITCDQAGAWAMNNFVESGSEAREMTVGVSLGIGALAYRNILVVDGATYGITSSRGCVVQNAIYSDGGVGLGIQASAVTLDTITVGNLVEGFSGAGGVGISIDSSTPLYGANAVFDCTTPYATNTGNDHYQLGDNEILSVSPFNDAANLDFSPVDTGNVKEGSLPNTFLAGHANNVVSAWKGAVEPAGGSGGGFLQRRRLFML